MAIAQQLEKVSILGKPTILIAHGLWLDHVALDLLQNVKIDPAATTKFALVTDTNLNNTYVPAFKKSFEKAQAQMGSHDELLTYTIPPGESSKSRDTVGAIHDWLAKSRCTKDAVVIALGGGVVGDMVGFAAATYMRGISVVQVPTTLLSMVDSSVGGKTAIDTPYGKNLVGAFWQPKRVYIDLKFLLTLPKREFINGMAEIIKTAAIWNEEEFEALEDNSDDVGEYLNTRKIGDEPSEHIASIFKRMIRESVKVKAHVVTQDEKEGGLRNLLNFGHSIGHGMEAILAPQILHGECVSIGMVKEAELSRYLGHLSAGAVARLTKCLVDYGLPITLNDKLLRKRSANRKVPVDDVISIMAVDKKNAGGKKRIVLLSAIGKTYEPKATAVSDDDIRLILSPAVTVQSGTNMPKSVTCTPPGSKSISNRALVLAALGSGKCRIKNLLHSDDTQVMLTALSDLHGAKFAWEDEGETLVVDGHGGRLEATSKELYLGNAGTASRFLTAVASLARPAEGHSSSFLTGNSRMKERPIGPLVQSLTANGVDVSFEGKEGSLPVRVAAAGGLDGGEIRLAATISSQYVSALLMCAPYAKSPITLRLVGGKPISQAYIDMTIAMMAAFGVLVEKSRNEEHVYHIPKQSYSNPSEYVIESDASSATYPLAIAAITGTTCTVPNIGSASLQGDAKFATDVLRPMGCTVEQTATSTTVTGPKKGTLKPLPTIDMEPMTDAFLTACVLAAVALPSKSGSTTRITGIANQRVKECDRIAAMRTQLAKFGVACREHDDGIEVEGRGLDLQKPSSEIFCYDDHRVAMSFSVLALVASSPVLLEDKNCTAKTWPAWWDVLAQQFKASLGGVELVATHVNGDSKSLACEKSIFLIGMRGAGKTTAGRWASPIMEWPFIDLDELLESDLGTTIPDLIRDQGWDAFRKEETRILKKVLKEKPFKHVFACGGGIVEVAENREILTSYHQHGGLVILIHRSIQKIVEYLQKDKTRPAYVDDIFGVWERRKAFYQECSNYEYHGSDGVALTSDGSSMEEAEEQKFSRFLQYVTHNSSPLADINSMPRSFFVSLTIPRFTPEVLDSVRASSVGSDAVELRVDLLEDPATVNGVPPVEYVVKECAYLRTAVHLPLIFTIRTRSQGGKFPDEAHKEALALYLAAIRLGFEFIDLEMTWPESLLETVTTLAGPSKIIASHHDPAGQLSWSTGAWIAHYNRALQYGSIIKLVSTAKSMHTNDELESFRLWAQESNPSTPLIALNMGALGKLSRIRNPFMTPVSHPALPFKAAPGQLSVAEIRQGLSLIGAIQAKRFVLFGKPIQASRSPALQNRLFKEIGLPHEYSLVETDNAKDAEAIIRAPDFGGASVTIPLKLDIMPYLDVIAPGARAIGAVNTIVPSRRPDEKPTLTGHNTDWRGMVRSLNSGGATPGGSGLVIGGGGTSRAAIYCLRQMGYSPIYVAGRTAAKLKELAEAFSPEYQVRIVAGDDTSAEQRIEASALPRVAIGTIPADRAIDAALKGVLEKLLAAPDATGTTKVLLEMAYKPRQTELMDLAESKGWTTVPGLEALVGQGVAQFELWTGLNVDGIYKVARAAVLGE